MSKATPFNGLRNTVAALMRLLDGKADKDKVVSSVNGQTGDVTVEVPQAAYVADVSGETVTGAEFNALLDALRSSGLMSEE